jgi:hypothetical protein
MQALPAPRRMNQSPPTMNACVICRRIEGRQPEGNVIFRPTEENKSPFLRHRPGDVSPKVPTGSHPSPWRCTRVSSATQAGPLERTRARRSAAVLCGLDWSLRVV